MDRIKAKTAPNTACTRLGVRTAFLSIFQACAGFRFEGESTLPPQAGNASRWVLNPNQIDSGVSKSMEMFLEFVSKQLNDDGFMFLFWAVVASLITLWKMRYFWNRKALSEAALLKISNEFEGINFSYFVFSVFVILPVLFFSLRLFSSIAITWIPLIFGIRLFPLFFVIFAASGFAHALFAIYKGVYPTGKSMSYIYDEKSEIHRLAKLQIWISLFIYVVLILLVWLN